MDLKTASSMEVESSSDPEHPQTATLLHMMQHLPVIPVLKILSRIPTSSRKALHSSCSQGRCLVNMCITHLKLLKYSPSRYRSLFGSSQKHYPALESITWGVPVQDSSVARSALRCLQELMQHQAHLLSGLRHLEICGYIPLHDPSMFAAVVQLLSRCPNLHTLHMQVDGLPLIVLSSSQSPLSYHQELTAVSSSESAGSTSSSASLHLEDLPTLLQSPSPFPEPPHPTPIPCSPAPAVFISHIQPGTRLSPSTFLSSAACLNHLQRLALNQWIPAKLLSALTTLTTLEISCTSSPAIPSPLNLFSVPITLQNQNANTPQAAPLNSKGLEFLDAIPTLPLLEKLAFYAHRDGNILPVFSIPHSWSKLETLKTLEIIAPKIQSDDILLTLTQLGHLRLQGSDLPCSRSLDPLSNLTSLSLCPTDTYGQLREWPSISAASHLLSLSLVNCCDVPDSSIPPTLTHLSVAFPDHRTGLTSAPLLRALPTLSQLKVLSLRTTTFPSIFFTVLSKLTTLHSLHLHEIDFILPRCITPITLPHLSQLVYKTTTENPQNADALIAALRLPHLSHLHIQSPVSFEAFELLPTCAPGAPTIHPLHILIDDDQLIVACQRYPDTRISEWAGQDHAVDLRGVTDDGLHLAVAMGGAAITSLDLLPQSAVQPVPGYQAGSSTKVDDKQLLPELSDEGLVAIGTFCHGLRSLRAASSEARGLHFSGLGVRCLANNLSLLTELELWSCRDLEDGDVRLLAGSCPQLEILVLTGLEKVTQGGYDVFSGLEHLRRLGLIGALQLSLHGLDQRLQWIAAKQVLLCIKDFEEEGVRQAGLFTQECEQRGVVVEWVSEPHFCATAGGRQLLSAASPKRGGRSMAGSGLTAMMMP